MQADLLTWRAPTVEPTPAKFRRAPGDPRDYAAEWLAFVDAHPTIAAQIETLALDAMHGGAARIEVNALFATVRMVARVTLNNSWRAAAADWLIARTPTLATLIRRRERKAK